MQGVRQFFVYIWENQWLQEKVECFLLYHFCSGVKHVAVEIEYREEGRKMKIKLKKNEDYEQGNVYLNGAREVEKEFVRVINWYKDAFRDEKSLQLMREIDKAERQGDYGIVTSMGESCITCLSTGCKFGLLVLFYHERYPHLRLIVEYMPGMDVWQWLALYSDATVYMHQKHLNWEFVNCKNLKIESEDGTVRIMDGYESIGILNPYAMTKETEAQAYEDYLRNRSATYYCALKEELDLREFLGRFSVPEYFLTNMEEKDYVNRKLSEYTVTNYLTRIPYGFPCIRHPLYICGEKDGIIECRKVNSSVEPQFWDILRDVLYGEYFVMEADSQKRYKFYEKYEKWFALILDANEFCLVKKYPEKTLMGIEVEWEKGQITIYESVRSIEHFHELYQRVFLAKE